MCHMVTTRRIQITDNAYPFLATDTGNVIRWSSGDMIEALYNAEWVEIAPRGIRIGTFPLRLFIPNRKFNQYNNNDQHAFNNFTLSSSTFYNEKQSKDFSILVQVCETVQDMLCNTTEGSVLPSPNTGFPIPSNPQFEIIDRSIAYDWFHVPKNVNDEQGQHDISIPFAYALQDACTSNGVGRVFLNQTLFSTPQYTITACDILQGHLVMLYLPHEGILCLLSQSLGPMAYCVFLIQTVICLYFATNIASATTSKITSSLATSNNKTIISTYDNITNITKKDDNNNNNNNQNNTNLLLLGQRASTSAIWTFLGCVLLYFVQEIPFLTTWDLIHFWLCIITGTMLALFALVYENRVGEGGEACIYALMCIADIMYRSPENAYSAIICCILAVYQWKKLFVWYDTSQSYYHCDNQPSYSKDPTKENKNSLKRKIDKEQNKTQQPKLTLDTFDLLITNITLFVSAEIGVAPQCQYPEQWPLFSGIALFISFAIALQQYHKNQTTN